MYPVIKLEASNPLPHWPLGDATAILNDRKISNIRRTKSQNLNEYRLVLHLSLPNLLKPCVK